MGDMKRWVVCAVALGVALTLVPGVAMGEAAKPAATTKATTTRAAGPQNFLDAVPAEAWGFVAIPNLKTFDKKLGDLSEKLTFPIDSPLTLAMGTLGIADGLREDAGLGVVVLDPTAYGIPPDCLVLLVPTTKAELLLEAFEPEKADEGLTKIDLMGQALYTVPKGGFLVVGADKTAVKYVADAKKGISTLLKPDQVARYNKGDLFAMVNLRPAIEMAKPFAGSVVGMLMMGSMDGDPDAAEEIQKTAEEIVNLLDELNTLEIALGLDDAGIQLSFFLTFLDGTITKKIAAADAKPTALLTGLPKDAYILAMGVKGSKSAESSLEKGLMGLFMSRPEVSNVIDKAKLEELYELGKQLEGMTGDVGMSVSTLPEGGDGMLGMSIVWESTDVKGATELLRKVIEGYKSLFKGEEIAKVLSALTIKAGAEKIGGVSVDHIVLDMAQIAGDDPDMQSGMAVVQKVVGKEGLLFRLAPAGDKHFVLTLGGGAKRLEEVMKVAAAGKGPLAEDAGVMKVRKKLPKKRMFELYVAVDQLLKAIRGISGSTDVPLMGQINAPLGMSLAAEKNYGRFDLVVPIELVVEIKNLVLQAMMGGFGGGAGGGEKPAEPSF